VSTARSLVLAHALAALMPVMTGPIPAQSPTIIARLCNGGTIAIPVGDGIPTQDENCHPKACHAGTCREKGKPDKLISRKDGI
jgi:hypothetical protein